MVIKHGGTDNFRSYEHQPEIEFKKPTAFVTAYLPAKAEIGFREGAQNPP